jgi:hypothetical protein
MSYKDRRSYRRQRAEEGIAPPEIVRNDYAELESKTFLRCSYEFGQLLLVQSVEGHCHAGHGLLYGKTFPNTSQDDIARALRLDPVAVKEDRQDLIDEVAEFVDRAMSGEQADYACNAEGEPLTRCGLLRQIKIDPKGVVQGIYLGGLRDDAEIREVANRRYGANMGYGKNHLVRRSVMRDLGLNGFEMASQPHAQDIERFTKAGLFAEEEDIDTVFTYIRYKTGLGASDDAAVIVAGKLFGLSAAIGCYLADAVDTLEKFAGATADQDSEISDFIEQSYNSLTVTRDDAADLAYLCAIPDDMKGHLPDSSLRHMLEVDRKFDQCALESHIAYVAGAPYSEMDIDHGECTNAQLYHYIDKRIAQFKPIRD